MDFPLFAVEQLGDHLRALRKKNGLTQSQLGKLIDVKQARIADIESDPGSISVAQLLRILTLLRTRVVLRVDTDGVGDVPTTQVVAAEGIAPHHDAAAAADPGKPVVTFAVGRAGSRGAAGGKPRKGVW